MRDDELQTKTLDREQRDQWEQANNDRTSHNVESVLSEYTSENKLITQIEVPTNISTIEQSNLEINRPCFMLHKDGFELDSKKMKPGVYWHGYARNEEVEINDWICDPLAVEAITSSDQDDEYGRLLTFRNSNGNLHKWSMPMKMLKSRGEELIGELLNLGLEINIKKRYEIVAYINNQKVNNRITCVTSIGWHNDSFILPNQVIGDSNVVYQSEVANETEFRSAGSIEDWKQKIGKFCEGNIPLMVSVSAALAGPLLKCLNRQGFCIHWIGDSSSGKSTAVEIAASIWGPQEIIRSWRSTSNGLEGIASARNDTCLVLDEIGEVSPNDVGNIAYMLVNGQGKQRSGRNGNARKIQRWRLTIISTGEKTLAGIMNEIDKTPQAGQEVRLLSIPAGFAYGVFSNLHGFENGRKFSDYLKNARSKNYGHIGPAFISQLIDKKKDLTELLDPLIRKFSENAKSSIEGRAASSFAMIALAGELGIEYGLLPWDPGNAINAALEAYTRWQEFQGVSQTEDEKILHSVQNFINKHGDSRFSNIEGLSEKIINNRAGFYKDTNGERTYMFFSEALQEAGGGYHITRIGRALDKAGWIAEKDKGRLNKKIRILGSLKNMYFISEKDRIL